MTKAQARAKLKPLLEKLGDLRAELTDLRDEVSDTAEAITPYNNRKSLRYEQNERKDWMESITDTLSDLVDEMSSAEWELEDK